MELKDAGHRCWESSCGLHPPSGVNGAGGWTLVELEALALSPGFHSGSGFQHTPLSGRKTTELQDTLGVGVSGGRAWLRR